MNKYLILILISLATKSFSQTITINGYVRDNQSKESLIGAAIYGADLKQGTTTNEYGFYSLTLPRADTVTIVVSYVGYRPEVRRVIYTKDLRLDIFLTSSNILKEVEISATRNDDNVNRAQVGTINVPLKEIKNLPVLAGERGILKTIQLLPGVQQVQEGTTGFLVRGGNSDQNLVQLDEAIVYNPNHLFGLVSTFNINSINNVQLIKGGFPAQYGGRLSSILDITMKDGNKETFHVEGGVGLLSTNLTVQGPIIKNKSSFIVSGRRSYLDLVQKTFVPNSTTLYSFYDLNAKLNFELGNNDKIILSCFKGRDNGKYIGANSLNYAIGLGNSAATLRWNHIYTSKLFSNTSVIYNNYDNGINTTQGNYYSLLYTGISDVNSKVDFTYLPNTSHYIEFGASFFDHTLFPAAFSSKVPKKGKARVVIDKTQIPKINTNEIALYASDEWKISDRFQ